MLVEEHLDRGTDFFRVLNLRKMFGVWNCTGLNGRVTFCIFFYDQIDILLSFAAEDVNTVVNFFQSLCNITFCIITLDTGVDGFRGVTKVGGLVIFVDVMRVNILRIIEVAFREGSGDNTSCGRKVVEQCTNDRKIKDKLLIPCGFSWYVAAGEQRIRIDKHHLLEKIRIVSASHCHDRSGRTGSKNVCAASNLGFYKIV